MSFGKHPDPRVWWRCVRRKPDEIMRRLLLREGSTPRAQASTATIILQQNMVDALGEHYMMFQPRIPVPKEAT